MHALLVGWRLFKSECLRWSFHVVTVWCVSVCLRRLFHRVAVSYLVVAWCAQEKTETFDALPGCLRTGSL